jgi:4-carboxymuconolactone decarboxylase
MRLGATPTFADPEMQAIHDFAHELVTARRVSEATHARARAMLGDRALVDLVGILGYYTLIAMTIVAFEVPVPEGSAEPFES